MAITHHPTGERWYQARIVGTADITRLAELDPRTTGYHAQLASRQAVAQLLPSALDIYLTTRTGGTYRSVRITNIPLGTFGLSIPIEPGGQAELSMGVWIEDNGEHPRAYTDDAHEIPLSSAIAAHAVRRALNHADAHVFDLGEYGQITWTPTTVYIEPAAGVPVPLPQLREFPYDAEVIGNYISPDPEYAVWMWFTDPATGEAEDTAYPLTPTLTDMTIPPRPPRMQVPTLSVLRETTDWIERG